MNRFERLSEANTKKRLDRFIPITESGCWIWEGAMDARGYGKYKIGARTIGKAHRLFYQEKIGPIPDGMVVRHRCDIRSCVNPDHLIIGTHAENVADRVSRGRGSFGAAHSEAIKRGLRRTGAKS